MKNLIKGLWKTREEDFPGLSIERDADRYWVLTHTRTGDTLITNSERTKLNDAAAELAEWFDWKSRMSYKHLKQNDQVSYRKIRNVIKKYDEEKTYNGAYLGTKSEDGQVEYHLQKIGWVKGEFVSFGLAIRQDKGEWSLDHIPSGMILTKMNQKEQVKKLIHHTNGVINWNDENAPYVIAEQEDIKTYFTELKQAIAGGTELPDIGIHLKMKMDFHSEEKSDERSEAFETAMEKLYGMIGLENIKGEIQHFMESLRGEKKLRQSGGIKLQKQALHMLFVGPPGSGKTEVARIISGILYALGFIRENKCIEVGRKDLVSEWIGGTEEKTSKVIQSALGGVLFVDEAYSLKGGDEKDHGRQALEEIMRAMENHREDLIVIFAGYEADIEALFKVNEGLRSRFPYTFHFQDYTPKQIAEIGIAMLESRGYECGKAKDEIVRVIKSKSRAGVIEGNARASRTLVERIVQMHKIRIGKANGHINVREILPEDILSSAEEINRQKDEEGLEQIRKEGLRKLDRMIGLKELKEEIKTWLNFIAIENKRYQQGNVSEKPSMHMTFEGEPGTGKTTVAKIIGEILKGTGMLTSGHFTELSRADLVGQYQGHTADKVRRAIAKAMGGVLFIDEAYDLVNGENDSFGQEVVNTLILEMENNRENLVVILAGYEKQMDELLQTNPGFESRIAERFLFADYQADELFQLGLLRMSELNLNLEEEAKEEMKSIIQQAVGQNGGKVNGNGRWVRKLCDKIKMAQANRLMAENAEDLSIIKKEDIISGFKKL